MSRFWQRVISASERLDDTSYYEVLGVSPEAGPVEIASRYYALVARLHPDRHARERDPARREALTKLFARIGDAYRVLTDPELRRAYDSARARGEATLAPEERGRQKPAPARDPATELARQLLEKGQSRLDVGDARGARSHLELAARYEPNSQAIGKALAQAQAALGEGRGAGTGGARRARATGGSPGDAAEGATAADPEAVDPEAARRRRPPSSGPASSARDTEPPPRDPTGSMPARPAPGDAGGGPTAATPPAAAEGAPAEEGAAAGSDPPAARAHPRVPADVRIKLKLPTWDRFEAFRTRDLSRGGMFVRAKQPLAQGTVVRLALTPPGGEAVEIRAQVVRTVGEGQSAGMGLRFLEVSEDTRRQIEALLAAEAGGAPPSPPPESQKPSQEEADRAGLDLRRVEPAEPRLHVRDRVPARPLLPDDLFDDAEASPAAAADPLYVPGETEAREGRERLAAGDPEGAIERLEAALAANPDDPRAHATLCVARAQIEERAGRGEGARAQYRAALEHDPQCAEAIEALRRG